MGDQEPLRDPSGVETAAADAVRGSVNAGWDHLDQAPGANDAIARGVGQLDAGLGREFPNPLGGVTADPVGQARVEPPTWGEPEEVPGFKDETAVATAEPGGVDSDTGRAREFGAIYAGLESYFKDQVSLTNQAVDYTLDEDAGWSLVYDLFDTGILELLEGEDIHMPIPESGFSIPLPEPDTAFIRLSDIPQGRTIRLGITFEGDSESQPSTDFGIEIDLAEIDGTVSIYESRTFPDGVLQGAEERVETEKAKSTPDQMRNIARILDKYSYSGTITRRATRRARAEGVIDPNQAVVIITTERVSGEMVGDSVLDAANAEVDAGQAHHSINDRPDST